MENKCRIDDCPWPATDNTDEYDFEGTFDGYCDDCRTTLIEDGIYEPAAWDRRPL